MQSSHLLATRRFAVALICLMVLTQASCTTLQLSPSFDPGSGETGSGDPDSDDWGLSDTGRAVGLVTLTAVGGYLLYKAFTGDSEEESGQPKPGSSHVEHRGTRLILSDFSLPRVRPVTLLQGCAGADSGGACGAWSWQGKSDRRPLLSSPGPHPPGAGW
jgi:hypothetical protein